MGKKLIILALLLNSIVYSQNKINVIVEKLDKSLTTFCPDSKKGSVFINIQEKILDIDGFQIPIEETSEIFVPESRIYKGRKILGYVEFKCKWNCIKNTEDNEIILAIGFGFVSKKGAYEFIELIYQLKKELLNE